MTPEVRRMLMGACIVAIAALWYFSMQEMKGKPAGGNTGATSAPSTSGATGGSGGSTRP
jgi:hypothetical protein